MREKIDYFFTALDFHLTEGLNPQEALTKTVEEYSFVFHTDDDRRPFNRAAEVALKHLQETGRIR